MSSSEILALRQAAPVPQPLPNLFCSLAAQASAHEFESLARLTNFDDRLRRKSWNMKGFANNVAVLSLKCKNWISSSDGKHSSWHRWRKKSTDSAATNPSQQRLPNIAIPPPVFHPCLRDRTATLRRALPLLPGFSTDPVALGRCLHLHRLVPPSRDMVMKKTKCRAGLCLALAVIAMMTRRRRQFDRIQPATEQQTRK